MLFVFSSGSTCRYSGSFEHKHYTYIHNRDKRSTSCAYSKARATKIFIPHNSHYVVHLLRKMVKKLTLTKNECLSLINNTIFRPMPKRKNDIGLNCCV